jgi:hypothetical protein
MLKKQGAVIYPPAVERIWHTDDSQGQILALALKKTFLTPVQLSLLRSAAETPTTSMSPGELLRQSATRVRLPPSRGNANNNNYETQTNRRSPWCCHMHMNMYI